MRALVTGATGFVGRHIVRVLLHRGFHVRAAHRRTSPPTGCEVEWVAVGGIGPQTEWAQALSGVDVVFHAAALAHQIGSRGEGRTAEFRRINVEGTRRLAAAVGRSQVRRLVFLSSVGAVTSRSDTRINQRTVPHPQDDYGRSKLAAEKTIAEELASGLPDWCIVRAPIVYGPGNPGNMARLLRLVESGVPLPLGRINNRRSLLYVGNLVDALIACATHPAATRQVFLVADGVPLSTPELVRRIAKLSGSNTRVFALPAWVLRGLASGGDVLARIAGRSLGFDNYSLDRLVGSLELDISDIQRLLDWKPPYAFDEALAETLGLTGRTRQ